MREEMKLNLLSSSSPSKSSASSFSKKLKPIFLAKYSLILTTVTTFLLLIWISTTTFVNDHHAADLHLFFPNSQIQNQENLRPVAIPEEVFDLQPQQSSHKDLEKENDGDLKDQLQSNQPAQEVDGEKPFENENQRSCATVEEMGKEFGSGSEVVATLKIRDLISRHFLINGAARVRGLPPYQFCRQGFVIGKASEAGFGNEMYKILTAAALSVILNRSLIIGQNRGVYPFEDYISYTSHAFTLKEVKHLWRKNDCAGKFGRNLTARIDNFEARAKTNVLCSDWKYWKQPIIWFQGTNDAVAIQFFLKNIHPGMKEAASNLLGSPDSLQSRPNLFGELMHVIVSPSQTIQGAVDWVLNGADPDVALHMRMLTNRSIRAMQAALSCVKRVLDLYQYHNTKPRILVVSDTPSFINEITPNMTGFAEVIHFDYKSYAGSLSSGSLKKNQPIGFRAKDWGPAPRWVAFVDFFLAARAKYAVISGAHRRVGTTYAQLIAALAATNRHGRNSTDSNFTFLSSFQSNLLSEGLSNQIGWGHAWNRFAGPLSCRHQSQQCAFTPLLPSAWWDHKWQSPIPRDIKKLQDYGVNLTDKGEVDESKLELYCRRRKEHAKIVPVTEL